jgi:hypothetical protein
MANDQENNRQEGNLMANCDRVICSSQYRSKIFEIRVKGHLNSQWSDWLEGLDVKLLNNGDMILFGPIVDQAALMGVLMKLSRLDLTIISVFRKQE